MMSTSKSKTKILPFDVARYLKDEVAIAECMTEVLETEDKDLLFLALGDIALAAVLKVVRVRGVKFAAYPA